MQPSNRMDEVDKAQEGRDTRRTRRDWLRTAVGAGIVALLPMLPGLSDPVRAASAKWIDIGPAGKFLKGQPQRIAVAGGGVLYVTRVGQAALQAVSAKCTHRGCEVGWDAADHFFHCPCHGAVFGSSGKNVHGTRRRPEELLPALPSVPVRQQGGQVQVSLQDISANDLHPGDDG